MRDVRLRHMRWSRVAGVIPIAIGVGTNVYFLGIADPFFAWTTLPYGVCGIALTVMKSAAPATVTAGIVAAMDVLNAYSVFVEPTSSTAALNLIWIPFWNLILICPIGLLVGKIIAERFAERNLTLQSRADGP